MKKWPEFSTGTLTTNMKAKMGTLIAETQVQDITEKMVAIVKFGSITSIDGTRAGEYYQVTIDPEKVSPCGKFIRFGNNDGDELIGWQKADSLTVVCVLGYWQDETKPILFYSPQHTIAMPVQITDNTTGDTFDN